MTTAKEITKSIRCRFGRPNHILAANVYLIGSPWESDLISITPANYYTEFEIKVSRADFKIVTQAPRLKDPTKLKLKHIYNLAVKLGSRIG